MTTPLTARYFHILFIILQLNTVTYASDNASNNLLQEMVKFDQYYIPALAFTSDEKLPQSRAAMQALLPVWQSLQQRYATAQPKDKQWQADFQAVNSYIMQADKIVISGDNLKDAHEALEHVRIVFMNLRQRNYIDYYIDNLTRYHEPMEKIVLAGKGKTIDTFTLQDLETIRTTVPHAKQIWTDMKLAEFDASLYGFNQEQAKLLKSLINQEMLAIDSLQNSLSSNDKQAIINAAVALKPKFASIFKMFGRFPNL